MKYVVKFGLKPLLVWTNSGFQVLGGSGGGVVRLDEDFAACSFANDDHARMADFPFGGNRIEMAEHVLRDPDSLDVIVLPKMVLQCAGNWKDSRSGMAKHAQERIVFEFRHQI